MKVDLRPKCFKKFSLFSFLRQKISFLDLLPLAIVNCMNKLTRKQTICKSYNTVFGNHLEFMPGNVDVIYIYISNTRDSVSSGYPNKGRELRILRAALLQRCP